MTEHTGHETDRPPGATGDTRGTDNSRLKRDDASGAGRGKPLRRRLHVSAGADLLIAAPRLLTSYVLVQVLGNQLAQSGAEDWRWLAPVLWLASTAVIFLPMTESLIAKLLLRLRQPMGIERATIDPLWQSVCEKSGQDPRKYHLWIEDTPAVNAAAASGHTVAVTRGAMTRLTPQQLEAILAHELGHHVGGHALVSMAVSWLTIPNRLVTRAGLFLFRVFRRIWAVALAIASYLSVGGFAVIFLLGILIPAWLALTLLIYMPWLILLVITPALSAFVGRKQELAADRIATDLGYGPGLIDTFLMWRAEGHDDGYASQKASVKMLASHPQLAHRVIAIEKRLARNASAPSFGTPE